MWPPKMGGVGLRKAGMLSSSRCLLSMAAIVTILAVGVKASDPIVQAPAPPECHFQPHVTSCDGNKLKYSVVVDGKGGDKYIINHSIERLPAPTPTPKRRRVRVKPDKEMVKLFPRLWQEKVGAWKEKMRLLIAKRRAKLRRQRQRVENQGR